VIKDTNRWLLISLGSAAVVILGLMIFLIIESHFFVKEARELVRLKEDYANYTLAFKRVIATYDSNEEEEREIGSGKKKKITNSEDEFVVVNRDVAYLRKSALKYARRYRLEDAVGRFYRNEAITVQEVVARPAPRRRTRRERKKYVLAVDNNLYALRTEHSFIWPLKEGTFRVTSRFGPRRKRDGSWGFHYGLDMAAPLGTDVRAVGHGVVVEARHARGFGNTVVISHSNKLKTRYAHLHKIDVKVGAAVEQGQRIGRVGNTGHTRGKNGIHLHLEVLVTNSCLV
jgi:murein DD-endopeptidase MepM/ murein hydrolase activator NlpD